MCCLCTGHTGTPYFSSIDACKCQIPLSDTSFLTPLVKHSKMETDTVSSSLFKQLDTQTFIHSTRHGSSGTRESDAVALKSLDICQSAASHMTSICECGSLFSL